MKPTRNTKKVIQESLDHVEKARSSFLMHNQMVKREGKRVLLGNGQWVTEFLNCSYLGLDVDPDVVLAYKNGVDEYGIGFCAARTRLSTADNMRLEEALSNLWGGRAVVFPSVTSTHQSVMPLLSAGSFWGEGKKVRFIFDKFAHSSMQSLIPILKEEASVFIIPHNDLKALKDHISEARNADELPVYVSDGIYSMGGHCPIQEVEHLVRDTDLHWYVDDAHGTSLFGEKGEGYILDKISSDILPKVVLTFSLAKGFGATGGGVLVFSKQQEMLIRSFGQNYMFSAPMDFGAISAAIKIVELHQKGEILKRREALFQNEELFNSLMNGYELNAGPIKMITLGEPEKTLLLGEKLLKQGLLVSTVFFPVVPRDRSQLRICLSALHSKNEITALAEGIRKGMEELKVC